MTNGKTVYCKCVLIYNRATFSFLVFTVFVRVPSNSTSCLPPRARVLLLLCHTKLQSSMLDLFRKLFWMSQRFLCGHEIPANFVLPSWWMPLILAIARRLH